MRRKFSIDEYRQTFLFESRLEELYEQQLFKLFVPKKYGGLELDLESGVHHLIDIASVQGGLGWTLNLGAGANWFSGFFQDQGAEEIFSPKKAVIAGSGFASGSYKQEKDHFIINGTWSRCTGADHATFFSLNAKNENGMIKTFVIPREQVEVEDEKWPIFGLQNTSSYAVSIQDQIIPSHYEFRINTSQNTNAYSVHAIPFEVFARVCMCASFLGIVKCLITQCFDYPLNKTSLELIDKQLQPMLIQAEKACLDWASKVDLRVQSDQNTNEISSQLKTELSKSNRDVFKTIQQLFLVGGLPFIEEDTLVHWAYRDVLTAMQHQMVKGELSSFL